MLNESLKLRDDKAAPQTWDGLAAVKSQGCMKKATLAGSDQGFGTSIQAATYKLYGLEGFCIPG